MTLPDGRFFKASEFACRDGTPYPEGMLPAWLILVALCDSVREIHGTPLRVASGYRTLSYNRKLARNSKLHQVASGSLHTRGMAADLAPVPARGLSVRDNVSLLHSYVLAAYRAGKLPTLGGLGRYPSWIHVDISIAPDGHLRQWRGA